MKPHLITSARPLTRSCGLSVSRLARSHKHAGGFVEGADEVLALGGVDPGLAADRGVDHAEHRGRDLDDAQPAQEGRRHEAGQIGRRSPADTDDRIGAGEAGLTERLPAERQHLGGLGLLGVGDLDRMHLETAALRGRRGSPARSPTVPAGGSPRPVGRRHRASAESSPSSPCPTSTSYGAGPSTRMRRHVGHASAFSTASATASGSRSSVSTVAMATAAYSGRRCIHQGLELPADVAEQHRPGAAESDPGRTPG